MYIKLVPGDRVANYGIALGELIYALSRALAWRLEPRKPELRQARGREVS